MHFGGVTNLADVVANRRRIQHHHAYRWVGGVEPSEADRRDPKLVTPPMLVSSWFRKPREMECGVFDTARQCDGWLALQFDTHKPVRFGMDPEAALQRALVCVVSGRNFHYEYGAADGNLVWLALVACPRLNVPCPSGPVRAVSTDA